MKRVPLVSALVVLASAAGVANYSPVAPQFGRQNGVQVAGSPRDVVVADFNGDGYLDFASANYSANGLSVYFGGPGGRLTLAQTFPNNTIPPGEFGIAAADFNRDGKADLIITSANSNM